MITARDDRQRLILEAQQVFEAQEAAIRSSRSEITETSETTVVQEARVRELEMAIERSRIEFSDVSQSLSEQTLQLQVQAQAREAELTRLATLNSQWQRR